MDGKPHEKKIKARGLSDREWELQRPHSVLEGYSAPNNGFKY